MPEAVSPKLADPALPQVAERHVFVYGTLRRAGDNDITRLAPAPRFVGRGVVVGTMYDFGAYPGVILGDGPASVAVPGEVYAIAPELEGILDEIEEVYPQQRDEYQKRQVSVDVGGVRLDCIFYEINPAYTGAKPVIASGDWLQHKAAS